MIKHKDYFKLFACCIPVKGISRSLVCDIQRNYFFYIPNILFEILTKHANKRITDIKKKYGNEADDVIDEYFDFLISNELGFFTDEPELFPNLNLEWKSPSLITNCILEVRKKSDIPFEKVMAELNEFNCKSLEIRFYEGVSLNYVRSILETTLNGRLQNIELILKFSMKTNKKNLEKLVNDHSRVNSILIHSSDFEDELCLETNGNLTNLVFTKQRIDSSLHCGFVHTNYFAINENSFTEAKNFNSCLNRKISIDLDGEIKHCPSMSKTYGNIKDVTLKEVVLKDSFKEVWNITKDQIEKCSDCEFRYVCTDCRAYLESPDNMFSAPLKCGYNPVTNIWSEWSQNPLKEKSIAFYGLNTEKIEKIK